MVLNFISLILCFVLCKSESVIRPRGVPLSMMSLYPTEGTFTCFDGSLNIPFDRINDDYCDCEYDGSDEPGTSACPNASFYCTNVGHKPLFIPSSRVNDGICDCCDGSDEYAVWDVTCENNCLELGQVAREEEARKLAMYKEGNKLRTELCFKGKQIKREKQLRLIEIRKEQTEAENLKNEKESLKQKIEEQEKIALDAYKQLEDKKREQKEQEDRIKNEEQALLYFREIDLNNDGVIVKDEIIAVELFDQDKDGVVSEEELKPLFAEEENLSFEIFLSNVWEYVKQLSAMQEIKNGADSSDTKEQYDSSTEKVKTSIDVEHYDENEEEADEEEEEDKDEVQHSSDSTEPEQGDTVEGETKMKYDEDTEKIIEEANYARSEYENAVRNLRDVEREIKQIEETLNKDYGKEDEFAYLVGECYEYTDREYTYKLCPFDQVSQRPKDGGIETRLGTWGHWVNDKYELMFFGNGQSCWNGPTRQTQVKLHCNLQTEVVGASEPSRCEYLLEFHTPAACSWKESQDTGDDYHDEL